MVEDDYDGEFQYGAQRIPALCNMAHDARVLYVGTFSKSLGAGLRLGFVVLPDALVDAFTRARALSDRQSPGAVQDVLARFIAEGHLLRHLRHMRELYRERQASMIASPAQATHGAITLAPSLQGMHLAFEVDERVRDTELSARAGLALLHRGPAMRLVVRLCGLRRGSAGARVACARQAAQCSMKAECEAARGRFFAVQAIDQALNSVAGIGLPMW